MNEKNQNDDPKGDNAVDDQKMDNLSQTEKAAFEKIMAEISVTGDNPDEAPTDTEGSDDKPLSTDTNARSADNSEQSAAGTDPDGAEKNPVEVRSDEDELSSEQQASLDQIMAEIGGGDTDNQSPGSEDKPTPQSDEQLSTKQPKVDEAKGGKETDGDLPDDQQAALNKIMAEINGDDADSRSAGDEKTSGDTTDQSQDETLPDDQQAALDKIMTEINGNETASNTTSESPPDDDHDQSTEQGDEDALPDEQQAALDQIMADIEGDKLASPAGETEKPAPPNHSDVTPKDINEKQPQNIPENAESVLAAEPLEDESNSADGLSLEEFDDQLSSLLTGSENGTELDDETPSDPPKQVAPAPGDHSLADINSALKDIVKESEPNKADTISKDSKADPQSDESTQAVLEEIGLDADTKSAKIEPGKRSANSPLKKALYVTGIVSICALLGWGGYFGYWHFSGSSQIPNYNAISSAPAIPTTDIVPGPKSGTLQMNEPIVPASAIEPPSLASPPSNFFGSLQADIANAREQLEAKKEEIIELKRYYQNGIQEEQTRLLTKKGSPLPNFKDAFRDRQTELGLRSIQRRMIYNAKLDTPLGRLDAALEQLLYLERRTRLFELLNDSISGLSLANLKNEGEDLIRTVLKESSQLSIDTVKVTPPSLKSIWSELNHAAATNGKASIPMGQIDAQDRSIGKEICEGHYARKYQLSALTTQTAKCLIQWPGKDLYLNELTYLSPEAARHLTLWQGEWLSLNGVKTLSADTAKLLAQWPGKRLSLNGVTRLSDEATAYLAQWHGDQLEMVGLTAIGRWENYVTRLFLSERLRRKLQVQ